MLNLENFQKVNKKERYKQQISRLQRNGYDVSRFQGVIDRAIDNLNNKVRSFVTYGDPQSGKTEMMILLTAKLLDKRHKIIIILLNDNLDLLEQNLERFAYSGLDPTPQNFTDIIRPEVKINNREWVIFCKKNSRDLQKLIEKIGDIKNKVIIDDEGDYATPNAKINKEEQTKINQLVEQLLGDGIYVGVTATPARLDLNNTFNNASSHWIRLKPHEKYSGQDTFFPIGTDNIKFNLNLLPDKYDDPRYLKEALLSFLVNAAYLNKKTGENYCMLIHTSGKKVDHTEDYRQVINTLDVLRDTNHSKFQEIYEEIYKIAIGRFKSDETAREITEFIRDCIGRYKIVIINSDSDRKYTKQATNPAALFTIAIGGNIVSRGVTFKSLLSMFFTRDVKHKMKQDTYIQRARMFGDRGNYLAYFELTIPEHLYFDWHKCFIFHRLSLEAAVAGNAPVWFEDSRVRAVSASSVDKTTVSMDNGEMSFAIFDYSKDVENIITGLKNPFGILTNLHKFLGSDCLPEYLINFITGFSQDGLHSLAIHPSTDISNRGPDTDKEKIQRPKGFIGNSEMEKEKYPHAIHHIKIFFNSKNSKTRIFYRYVNNIKFLKRLKNI